MLDVSICVRVKGSFRQGLGSGLGLVLGLRLSWGLWLEIKLGLRLELGTGLRRIRNQGLCYGYG